MTDTALHLDLAHPAASGSLGPALRAAVTTALDYEQVTGPLALSLVVGDDTQLRELHRQYMGDDTPTDVLSFPADDIDPDDQHRYLGDIIISYDRAQVQAASGGHSTQAELQLLAVHGVLHLLGYDHQTPEDMDDMWQRQAAILKALGCEITAPALGDAPKP